MSVYRTIGPTLVVFVSVCLSGIASEFYSDMC